MSRDPPVSAIPIDQRPRRWTVLFVGFVGVVTVAVFWPATRHGFVNWDDPAYFLKNTKFHGLRWSNFIWFFTTTYMGHYQPLNWLSFAIDYSISGLNPGRLHLTQVLLHGVVAVLFFFVARNLLRRSSSDLSPGVVTVSGAVAAMLFAIHPLRVEPVAWASARPDVLATAFFLSALLAYVNAVDCCKDRPLHWMSLLPALFFFVAALLSKEMAVTLPAILLLLDVFPFRRLSLSPRRWSEPCARDILVEKIPFFVLAAAATINAFPSAGAGLAGFAIHPFSERLAHAPVSLVFYLQKTLVPVGLSPFYDYPLRFGWSHRLVWTSLAVLAVIVFACWLLRRRLPALAAAAVAYFILISPVCGLTQRGPQFTADRYSYLSCLPWAILVAGLFAWCYCRLRKAAILVILVLLTALTWLTERQIPYWADSVTLWEYALRLDPLSSLAYANVGQAYDDLGRVEDAIRAYKRALAIRPHHPDVQRNLAGAYNRLFRNEEAIEAYRADLADHPNRFESHYYLAVTYERIGDDENAQKQYREALRIDPKFADAHVALGRLFLKHGFLAEAQPRLRYALELQPAHLEALQLLARCRAEEGHLDEADSLMKRAIEEGRRRGDEKLIGELRQIRQELEASAASRPATSR